MGPNIWSQYIAERLLERFGDAINVDMIDLAYALMEFREEYSNKID